MPERSRRWPDRFRNESQGFGWWCIGVLHPLAIAPCACGAAGIALRYNSEEKYITPADRGRSVERGRGVERERSNPSCVRVYEQRPYGDLIAGYAGQSHGVGQGAAEGRDLDGGNGPVGGGLDLAALAGKLGAPV